MTAETDTRNASQASVTGLQTTILESVAMGAGIAIIGLSYIAGVITPAGITAIVGSMLILSAVVFIVAAWMGDRTDKRLRTILYAIDRNERDRIFDGGAVMDRLEATSTDIQLLISQRAEDLAVLSTLAELMSALQRIEEHAAGQARQDTEAIRKVIEDMGERIEQMWVACDAAEARRNVEHHAALDNLSETFASELLAINGATNGLRSSVDDVLKRVAPDRPIPESDDPIADLIRYKTESGDLWVTSATGTIVAGDDVETESDQ